ncbi:MAG: hypothetical protein P8Y36_10565 [Alphaproteobacteria bacterium]
MTRQAGVPIDEVEYLQCKHNVPRYKLCNVARLEITRNQLDLGQMIAHEDITDKCGIFCRYVCGVFLYICAPSGISCDGECGVFYA